MLSLQSYVIVLTVTTDVMNKTFVWVKYVTKNSVDDSAMVIDFALIYCKWGDCLVTCR